MKKSHKLMKKSDKKSRTSEKMSQSSEKKVTKCHKLVNEKEDIKCNNKRKKYKRRLTSMMLQQKT